jgi:type I restriction enzyme R subunit
MYRRTNGPFDALGGIGKFYQIFGEDYDEIINELNEVLVA